VIASLRGRLLRKDAEHAVIDCGGVGYCASMSLSSLAHLGAVGSEVAVHVHTHLSQDSLRLFGFVESAELEAFEILIATSGVGPKLALSVLSALSPNDLAAAIARGDRATLTRIPGVGAKKAERLLLELKDKLPYSLGATDDGAPRAGTLLADATSALVNLGFAAPEASEAARAALKTAPEETEVASIVRAALQQLR